MSDEKKTDVALDVPTTQKTETMSHRQLRAELRRVANRPYAGKEFSMGGVDFSDPNPKKKSHAGLDNALAVALSVVLDNTKIESRRKDQVGPGKLNSYLV
jgi:hypothetical protein